ncbi:Protein kinase domain-containing protein [Entamoeba marina]
MSSTRLTLHQLKQPIEDGPNHLEEMLEVDHEIAHGKFGSVFLMNVRGDLIQQNSKKQSISEIRQPSNQLSGIREESILQKSRYSSFRRPSIRQSTTQIINKKESTTRSRLSFSVAQTKKTVFRQSVDNINNSFFEPNPKRTSQVGKVVSTHQITNKTTLDRCSVLLKPKHIALKVQGVKTPNQPTETSYVECRIFKHLSKLITLGYCNNFAYMYGWWMSYITSKNMKCQQIHFVMEYCEKTLAQVKNESRKQTKKMTMKELKEIIFQVIWGIGVAQKELEFVHNDLHPKNIMINKSTKKHIYKNLDDKVMWETDLVVAKITDFGSSRIKLQWNEKDSKTGESSLIKEVICKDSSPLFESDVDIIKFVDSLKDVKITNDVGDDNQPLMDNDTTGDNGVDVQNKINSLNLDKKLLASWKKLAKTLEHDRIKKIHDLLYHEFFNSLRVNTDGPIKQQASIYSYVFKPTK